jgi:ATP phosphoribosyltransferase regulatory subunit
VAAHTLIEVPSGVQCFVGEEARRRREIESRVLGVFQGWAYEEIIPPLFDYADVFSGPALTPKTYSFVSRDGSLLALRPDFTSLIAKIAAGRLADRPAPLRLYYSGEVLRYEPPKAGRQGELYQMGLERIGGDRLRGDAEVLAIAAECLEAAGVGDFVLAVGHVGVFAGLLRDCEIDPAAVESLRERVEAKDEGGVREALERARVPPPVADALRRLSRLSGGREVLEEASRAFAFSEPARTAVAELQAVAGALAAAGLESRVSIDLGEVRGLDYYTGLVFRAFARGLGFEVGGGGRYDALLSRFGRPLPAVGFMLGLDRLALLLEKQGRGAARPAAVAETVAGGDLADDLRRARERRSAGARIRLADGA